jgi:3-oxoacyl-[acyl-carrier-protein] synthase II
VAVTGTGLVCSLGRERRTVLEALLAGKSGVRELARPGLARGAPVADFDAAREAGPTKNLKYMSRASALAVAAARLAVKDAALPDLGDDLGAYVGLGMTSSELGDLEKLVHVSKDENGRISSRLVGEKGLRATNPLISFKILSNMPLCHVALATKARGSNVALHSVGGETFSCLAEAVDELREGRVKAALFGAVDAQLERAGAVQIGRTGVLAEEGKPGRELGEGAAFCVLEREEDARARGARVLAIIEGFGLAFAPGVRLGPAPAEALRKAIEKATGGAEVGGVFASAAGDARGDEEERRALEGIEAPVTRTRNQLGETLAAGPAIDLVLAVAQLEHEGQGGRTGRPPHRGPGQGGRAGRPPHRGPVLVVASSLSGTVGAALVGAAT